MNEKFYVKRGKKYLEAPEYFNVDDEILLFCAFRYALGRMTYVIGPVVSAIKRASIYMDDNEKKKYVDEIVEYYYQYGSIGMDFDTENWIKLACYLDPDNKFSFEANYYKTDKWEHVDGFFFNNKYYSRETYMEYHTIRNIKGPENFKTKLIFNNNVREEVF